MVVLAQKAKDTKEAREKLIKTIEDGSSYS